MKEKDRRYDWNDVMYSNAPKYKPLFRLGILSIDLGAEEEVDYGDVAEALANHSQGLWSDTDVRIAVRNDDAVRQGGTIASTHVCKSRVIRIETAEDRLSTRVFLE